jgi:hypothetical protein
MRSHNLILIHDPVSVSSQLNSLIQRVFTDDQGASASLANVRSDYAVTLNIYLLNSESLLGCIKDAETWLNYYYTLAYEQFAKHSHWIEMHLPCKRWPDINVFFWPLQVREKCEGIQRDLTNFISNEAGEFFLPT